MGFIVAFAAIAISGIVLIVIGILGLILGSLIIPTYLLSASVLFTGIGLVALGIIGVILSGWVTVWFVRLLIKYGSWNLKIIQGGI